MSLRSSLICMLLTSLVVIGCRPMVAPSERNDYRVAHPHARADMGRATVIVWALHKRQDVSANCTVSGDGYSMSVVAPAHVSVPIYGRGPEPVNIECTYQGETKAVVAQKINATQADIDRLSMCQNPNRYTLLTGDLSISAPVTTCTGNWLEQLREARKIPASEHVYSYNTPALLF